MDAPSSSSDRDPLERLAAEFLDRRRRGENPSPSEYAEQYPQWAEQILEFFPALELMEGLKPATNDRTASVDAQAEAAGTPASNNWASIPWDPRPYRRPFPHDLRRGLHDVRPEHP